MSKIVDFPTIIYQFPLSVKEKKVPVFCQLDPAGVEPASYECESYALPNKL